MASRFNAISIVGLSYITGDSNNSLIGVNIDKAFEILMIGGENFKTVQLVMTKIFILTQICSSQCPIRFDRDQRKQAVPFIETFGKVNKNAGISQGNSTRNHVGCFVDYCPNEREIHSEIEFSGLGHRAIFDTPKLCLKKCTLT